ncbi:trans-aconitate 2-methyltransferase [Pilimelia terevasa]|uniref:Trans-aconitate 2-methyltransferase n=1 Tax=Pilimelia terevasa TaxID=53372 RepID=A0A8J3FJX3_9ACTN|nr:methyltransferase domain-containing protein [Pilimelia terevasa]GGK25655.1 trans-aconitate 2-methyltransferase [Pilimelia terevasa]
MWDPTAYLRFADHRSRPFAELLARVLLDDPRRIVDLGCGPGHLTAQLAARWPRADVSGVDADPAMVARATADHPRLRFTAGDAREWTPPADLDLLVCHAVLQWVPGHPALLARWAGELPARSWVAVQVPGNNDTAAHRIVREVAGSPPWRSRLAAVAVPRPVPDPVDYAALLHGTGAAADVWETTYVHLLPAPAGEAHPVLRWLEGTGLRPVRAALPGDADWQRYREAVQERLARAYPVRDGVVYYPFRRIFVAAQVRAAHAVEAAA